jgi:hypothetical protein
VGWTGSDCSADCGCHQHSRCSQGRGRCERCEHHTAGPACASCAPGSWGNATTAAGCRPCQCNGHEDSAEGTCDAASGDCFCLGSRVSHSVLVPKFFGSDESGCGISIPNFKTKRPCSGSVGSVCFWASLICKSEVRIHTVPKCHLFGTL